MTNTDPRQRCKEADLSMVIHRKATVLRRKRIAMIGVIATSPDNEPLKIFNFQIGKTNIESPKVI